LCAFFRCVHYYYSTFCVCICLCAQPRLCFPFVVKNIQRLAKHSTATSTCSFVLFFACAFVISFTVSLPFTPCYPTVFFVFVSVFNCLSNQLLLLVPFVLCVRCRGHNIFAAYDPFFPSFMLLCVNAPSHYGCYRGAT